MTGLERLTTIADRATRPGSFAGSHLQTLLQLMGLVHVSPPAPCLNLIVIYVTAVDADIRP
jgi:hypothetical protein